MTLLLLKLERAKKVVSLCFTSFISIMPFGLGYILCFDTLRYRRNQHLISFQITHKNFHHFWIFSFKLLISAQVIFFIYLIFFLNWNCQNVDVLTEQFNLCVFDVFFG